MFDGFQEVVIGEHYFHISLHESRFDQKLDAYFTYDGTFQGADFFYTLRSSPFSGVKHFTKA